MFENMMSELRDQLKYDINYFKKHNVKSAMLQRVINSLGLDDDDVKKMRVDLL